jgi:hypothetical protein
LYLNILLGKEQNSALTPLDRGIEDVANDVWTCLFDRIPEMKWDVGGDT